MKTRRKVAKNAAGGLNASRRSSIICVKRSPIVRRYPRRNIKNRAVLAPYESPIKHLHNNSLNNTPSTSKTQLKSEVTDASTTKQASNHPRMEMSGLQNISPKLELPHMVQSTSDQQKKDPSVVRKKQNSGLTSAKTRQVTFAQANSSKRKKRNAQSAFRSTPMPKTKKKKLNKSPLSRFHDLDESIKNFNSIIVLEDSVSEVSDVKPLSQPSSNELIKELGPSKNNVNIKSPKLLERDSSPDMFDDSDLGENLWLVDQPSENLIPTTSTVNNEEVIVIDCNNSTLKEMEDIHDKFHEGDGSSHADPKIMDSIIVIDPDDDIPVEKPSVSSKNEDCFVVWASSPAPNHPSTGQSSVPLTNSCPSTSVARGRHKYNSHCNYPSYSSSHVPCKLNPYRSFDPDLLKQDKILIDTQPDLQNLRIFNNENNRPFNRRNGTTSTCYPRAPKETWKNCTPSKTCDPDKTPVRTAPRISPKSRLPTTTTKTAKNNEELIFLSESQCESDSDTKKSNSKKGKLREIVIDGNNVAMAYNHSKMFSEKGIKILIEYFTKKGHTVKVFIPQTRRSVRYPLLEKWHRDGIVIFTPGRKVGHKFITSYDDRYILEYATACGGIVVSQDQFRDLYAEKSRYKDTIENRLLIPTFAGEYVMFPDDPLGRNGPTLQEFLRH